jgi:ABC-type polysaccharide/polyol phosphate transport system ATPase subunit
MLLRLAYSIAIQVDFDILLLDEVLAVGDQSFQEKCFSTFQAFREEGKTIVLVTHDLSIVERFADRALEIGDGRVRMIGSPAAVVEHYRGWVALSGRRGDAGQDGNDSLSVMHFDEMP